MTVVVANSLAVCTRSPKIDWIRLLTAKFKAMEQRQSGAESEWDWVNHHFLPIHISLPYLTIQKI